MEDEVCYSTVIFKTSDNDQTKESEESVLYAEVKRNKLTSEVPPQLVTPQESSEKGTISPSFGRTTVFLGLFCFLLLSALIAVCVLNYIHTTDYNKMVALYNEKTTVNQQLLKHQDLLEKEKERLKMHGEELNGTLDYILKQSTLSVEKYCHSTDKGVRCKPCLPDWIRNGSSCYYFYLGSSHQTWTKSQEFCKNYGAHLAIIDNVEEQEFVNQHTKLYYDDRYGYWIGLSAKQGQAGTWVWTNGVELKTGFWYDKSTTTGYWTGYCVFSLTSSDPVKSWRAFPCYNYNRWICEMKVLPWPKFLRMNKPQLNDTI